MRYIDRGTYTEMHPENDADVICLLSEYAHCFPCDYVCIANRSAAASGNLDGRPQFVMRIPPSHGVSGEPSDAVSGDP